MNQADFDSYVQRRYEDQIRWYDGKAASNKRRYYIFQSLVVCVSAGATMTIALGVYFEDTRWIRLAALGMTTVVTALVSLQKVFRFQEQWIEYRTTAETLKKEKPMYDAQIGEYEHADSPERMFVGRVENCISTQNTKWVEGSARQKE